MAIATAKAVGRLLRRTDGDVLVFLPGMAEIRQPSAELGPLAEKMDLAVLPLHGDLPAEQQDAALLAQPRRKVVLSTNVAETSVTVNGVTGVVDIGLARVLTFDPAVGLDRLDLAPISKSSAAQRAGLRRPGATRRLRAALERGSAPGPSGTDRAGNPPRRPGRGPLATAHARGSPR